MKSLAVLFALSAMACGSYIPLAQPPHLPALVLDARGRPLDTAEVIHARALHLQAKALEGHYGHAAPAIVATPIATSVYGHATPLLAQSAGHYLHKGSLEQAHITPAVSHQSRVDIISRPAAVSQAVAAPVVSHAAPVVAHDAPAAAVSHQSRVDIISSPAVVSHAAAAPVAAHDAPVIAHAPAVSHQSRIAISSPAVASHTVAAPVLAHAAPAAAMSHQFRQDIISTHRVAAPVEHAASIIAHAKPIVTHAAPAVSHQSRVDIFSSPALVSHDATAPVLTHTIPVSQNNVITNNNHGAVFSVNYEAPIYSAPFEVAW